MRIGSLFSGAGGLDMAVESVFGGEVVWHSEIDKAASKVLAHRFPDVPNLGDITEINWANWKPMLEVDVLCGGFPCQDVSAAGKRAGIKDGTRSGLWAVFAEAIDQLRPQFVVIENVRGLLNATAHRGVESDDAALGVGGRRPVLRAAGAVLGDLADLGYDAAWATVAASSVGAPHRRDRVFILACTDGTEERQTPATAHPPAHPTEIPAVGVLLPSPRSSDGDRGPSAEVGGIRASGHNRQMDLNTVTVRELFHTAAAVTDLPSPLRAQGKADATGKPPASGLGSLPLLPTPEAKNSHAGPDYARMNRQGSGGHDLVTALTLLCTPTAEPGGSWSGKRIGEPLLRHQARDMDGKQWGKYAPAINRWEQIVGPAPAPTEPNSKGNPRLNPAFSEWLMGWPAGWVTDPAIGISRNDQLKICGNGVVPQQAAAAIQHLLEVTA